MEVTFSYAQLQSPKHFLQDSLCNAGGKLEKLRLMAVAKDGVTGGVYRHLDVQERGAFYAVLDGVGGCKQPKRAAELGAEVLRSFVKKGCDLPADERGLREIWKKANDEVHALGVEGADKRPLGAAAATGIWIPQKRGSDGTYDALIGHAGDTSAWLWNGSELVEITGTGNSAKVIRNYVGVGAVFEVTIHAVGLEAGRDVIVLATDGVTKVMGTPLIAGLMRDRPDVESIARDVAFNAHAKKSTDDITVMAVQITND
jgi:serine/threonine protein phosphatase PrpC